MAFDIIAEVHFRAASGDIRAIYNTIHSQIGDISKDVRVNLDPTSISNLNHLKNNLSGVRGGLSEVDLAATRAAASIRATGKVAVDTSGFLENLASAGGLAAKRFAAFTVAAGSLVSLAGA